MTTYKKGNVTIKNFGNNKGAAINYFQNVRTKDYVKSAAMCFYYEDAAFVVMLEYKKN